MSKASVCGIRSWLRVTAALAGASLLMAAQAPSPRASGKAARTDAAAAPGGLARLVQIPGGRRLYLECRGRGGPTVVLVSVLGNAGDVWGLLDPEVSRPPVLAGVARSTRVCA